MQIKMLTGIGGTDFSLAPGDVTDRFDDAEAQRLIDGDHAVLYVDKVAERAVKKGPAETR